VDQLPMQLFVPSREKWLTSPQFQVGPQRFCFRLKRHMHKEKEDSLGIFLHFVSKKDRPLSSRAHNPQPVEFSLSILGANQTKLKTKKGFYFYFANKMECVL
jgi:hypothetical protein